MDYTPQIKDAVEKAKAAFEKKEYGKAATFYDTAAKLATLYADDAPGRDAEVRWKDRALKWRAYAQRLRAGDTQISEIAASDSGNGAAAPSSTTAGGGKGAVQPEGGESELRQAVKQTITASPVMWKDIGGLEETKQDIKYALGITLAMQPEGVTLSGFKNILFYGPPGTGKTLLAAATSNAVMNSEGVRSVFFNVKVSSVVSKYFGESSKLISELYGVARDASPSVVFLDEFESLCPSRDSNESGPERRILSTLLSELDGLDQKGRRDVYVLTIAATNRPWDLDAAILSRFEKKILIPLPDEKARAEILKIHLDKRGFRTAVDYETLSNMTKGYSGREIERFSKEVTSRMVAEMNRDIPRLIDEGLDEVKKYKIQVRDLALRDFETARARVNPQTTDESMKKYLDWKESTVD